MKKLSLSTFLILISLVQFPRNDINKYKSVYNNINSNEVVKEFILRNKISFPECIKVSNEVIHKNKKIFYDQLISKENLNSSMLLDSLSQSEKERHFKNYKTDKFLDVFDCKESNVVIFFSDIYADNTVFLELFVTVNKSKEYLKVSPFNIGLLMLFELNDDGEVAKSYSTEIEYN